MMQRISLVCLGLLGWVLVCSCQTPPKSTPASEMKKGAAEEKAAEDDHNVSGNFSTFAFSLSNNSLTSKTVLTGKAKEYADELDAKLNQPTSKDRKDLLALMASKRFSGQGLAAVFQVAKKLMIVEMREDIRHEMPEVGQLELALASIQSHQFSMAEHWLQKLHDSKNDKIKAAALTAKGMIAMLDNRLPEAVSLWNEAIAVRKDYEPARLNIGFTALRFGDFRTARAMLVGISEDWFVQTGLMQAERLADNAKEVASLCSSIQSKRKGYKPALFSCALNEYQGLNNPTKAKTDLEQLSKIEGGPASIDEKAYVMIGRIDRDLREQQQKERAAAAPKGQATPSGPGKNPPAQPEAGEAKPNDNAHPPAPAAAAPAAK